MRASEETGNGIEDKMGEEIELDTVTKETDKLNKSIDTTKWTKQTDN